MQKDHQPFISVITLNYNQTDVTCEFLESTRKWTYPNYEILVCDMASAIDPSEKILAGNYPHTRLLLSKENLGFAGGNNWGMRQATGDFIFIVNNDTEVTPDLAEKLLKPFFEDDTIGVTCPKIKYFYQPNVIQYAGFNPMNNFTGRTTSIGILEEDKGQYDASRPTYGAHGCAMMVKREVLNTVGMFPEKFFLYYEEWDWSSRIMKAGYHIWYTANAVIYHKESVSVLVVFFLFFLFLTLPKNMITYLAKKQFTQLKYFLKGVFWNLHSSSYSPV